MLIAHAYCFRTSRQNETHFRAQKFQHKTKRSGTSVINASADFHGSEYFVPTSITTYFFANMCNIHSARNGISYITLIFLLFC